MEKTKERWFEADIQRIAGEIAREYRPSRIWRRRKRYFSGQSRLRARSRKVMGLRAAMSLARLWRDQGKRDAARDLLAPVYSPVYRRFDTLDLKEAKALLDELAA